ncbi:MAG: UvrD-helicase domain-containing protein, partial [Clostridia bacterium]|nr:UvrD-helicase domain-containing protein [Clostridia bacterium]
AAMKQVKDLREQARAALKRIRLVEYPLEQCILDLRAQQPQVRRLGALALRTLAILDEKKAELGGLSYSDLERFTLAALRDEDTARAVREQYDDIFVDEYQDTSDIQEAIVSRICGKDNRFMVGDVKQSIYRFRQAEPRLFLEKYREYGVGNGGTLLPLTRNFRSRPTVLEFVNTVFERAMIGGDTEIEYDELARLHPGRTFDTPDMPVEIHLLEKLSQEDGEIDEAISEMKDAEREGLLIARRIRELMQEDASLRYRDIAILTRTGAQTAAAMMPHLLAAGIPAYSDSSAGYFDTLEVSLAISMLRVLANRRSDVALIGVLRSPAAQLNAESLAQIRILYRDCSFADASWRVAWGVPLGEIPTEEGELPQGELAEGLRAFWSAMEGWRLLLHSMELGALLRKMLLESGVYTYMGALPGGAQRQANLGRLVDVAGRFDREVSGSLPRFLRHVEKLKNRGEGEAAHLLGENDDVVRIMTIHKSKGLEFRAVFGALLNRRYRAAQAEALSVHRDLGLSFAHYDPALRSRRKTLAQAAIGERMNREDAAEEMRVLYVLLTRAKERLILTGSVKDIDKSQKTWLAIGALPQMAKSHLELIMGALLAAQSEGKHTYAEMHMHALSELNLSEAEPERAQVAFERALEGAANAADQAAIEEMEWVYPEPLGAGQPLKLTVSGLLRNLEGPQSLPDILERPQFMQDAAIRPLTGAERGTAYHRAMQLLDWSRFEAMPLEATTKEIAAQLAQFAAERLMTEAQVEAVQPSRIARFFL